MIPKRFFFIGLLFPVLLFPGVFPVVAQEKFKFGEVPLPDLSMTVYPEDTTAVAATL
jgi:hypothetical protein